VQAVVDERIDRFIQVGRVDLVSELTGPVPAVITAEGLGVPVDRADQWAAVFHDLLSGPETEDALTEILARLDGLLEELAAVIERRSSDPKDDWISALLSIEIDGEAMSKAVVLENAHLLFSGGVETSSSATSWALLHLANDPELRSHLQHEPELLPAAIEEFLRYYSVFVTSARTVTEDTDLAGVPIEGGKRALLAWASANRDPAVFEHPDDFILARSQNRHLAFGHGDHKCLGQYLARLEMDVMISTVLQRMPDYKVDHFTPYRAGLDGVKELVVSFTPVQILGSD
jgi:cytochrome P450